MEIPRGTGLRRVNGETRKDDITWHRGHPDRRPGNEGHQDDTEDMSGESPTRRGIRVEITEDPNSDAGAFLHPGGSRKVRP